MILNQKKNSAWFYNKTKKDIVLSELGLKLPAGQALDFFKHKKDLRSEVLRYSERFGSLSRKIKAGEIVRLSGPPEKKPSFSTLRYTEAEEPIYSKIRTAIEVNTEEKDYVDQLQEELMQDIGTLSEDEQAKLTDKVIKEISVENLEGFADPLQEE